MTTAAPGIGIVGAGAWGTALAETLARGGHPVVLWARNPAIAAEITTQRTNNAYLPGHRLSDRLVATSDLARVAGSDILLMVTPAQATRAVLTDLRAQLRPATAVVLCAKGIEQSTGRLQTEVAAEAVPGIVAAVLSGPSFAADVVRGLPTALTLAAADPDLGRRLADTLSDRRFRLYWSDDLTGVQLGGAVKNVLAIAAGILDGRQLGASALAALVTRGFAELRRFAQALGGRPETLMGLSGLGDLMLTCGSPLSRNMSLGRALGRGESLEAVLGGRRSVSEGIYTAGIVARLAAERRLDMPIATAVAAIVAGELGVDAAIEGLLARPLKAED